MSPATDTHTHTHTQSQENNVEGVPVRVEKYVLKDLLAHFSSSFFIDVEEGEEKEGEEEDEVERLKRCVCVCV